MQSTDEQRRRERRSKRAAQFAEEVATWPSLKLRMAYAQPAAVRAAEEREQGGPRKATPKIG